VVIRRESSGGSSLKGVRAWWWPPRGAVAVPTRVHVDGSSNFSKGVLGTADRSPPVGFRGKTPVRDPGYFVPQKLKQNVTLLYT